MTATITAFERSPDRGRGLARDMRLRWALEELGQPYQVRTLSFADLKQPPHLALNPFGQIPTYEDGEQTLFESGAIVLHLAETHPGLLPADPHARMRAIAWMFAALNTVEPPVFERSLTEVLEREEPWYAQRAALLDQRVHRRLSELSRHLGDAAARLPARLRRAVANLPPRPGGRGIFNAVKPRAVRAMKRTRRGGSCASPSARPGR